MSKIKDKEFKKIHEMRTLHTYLNIILRKPIVQFAISKIIEKGEITTWEIVNEFYKEKGKIKYFKFGEKNA